MNRKFLRVALALVAGAATAIVAAFGLATYELLYEDFWDEDPTPEQLQRGGAVIGSAFTAGCILAHRQLRKVLP